MRLLRAGGSGQRLRRHALNADHTLAQMQADMKFGVVTINNVRQSLGLPPVSWGPPLAAPCLGTVRLHPL